MIWTAQHCWLVSNIYYCNKLYHKCSPPSMPLVSFERKWCSLTLWKNSYLPIIFLSNNCTQGFLSGLTSSNSTSIAHILHVLSQLSNKKKRDQAQLEKGLIIQICIVSVESHWGKLSKINGVYVTHQKSPGMRDISLQWKSSSAFFTKYQNLPLKRAEMLVLEDNLPQNLSVGIPVLLKFVSF